MNVSLGFTLPAIAWITTMFLTSKPLGRLSRRLEIADDKVVLAFSAYGLIVACVYLIIL